MHWVPHSSALGCAPTQRVVVFEKKTRVDLETVEAEKPGRAMSPRNFWKVRDRQRTRQRIL